MTALVFLLTTDEVELTLCGPILHEAQVAGAAQAQQLQPAAATMTGAEGALEAMMTDAAVAVVQVAMTTDAVAVAAEEASRTGVVQAVAALVAVAAAAMTAMPEALSPRALRGLPTGASS